jgi:hypothetical protein
MKKGVQLFNAGDVVHIVGRRVSNILTAGACLPPILIVAYAADGMWEGKDGSRPMYVGYAVVSLSDLTRSDKEAGLPGCHYVRDAQWLARDNALLLEGDMVVTDEVFYLLECMFPHTEVVGRVSEEVLAESARKREDFSAFARIPEDAMHTRMNLHNATLVANKAFLATL